ncbi:uncharacterized protein LOC120341452 isoform X1 [Styela clava]
MFVYYAGKAGLLADLSGRREKTLKSGTVPPKAGRMVSLGIITLASDDHVSCVEIDQKNTSVMWLSANARSAFMQMFITAHHQLEPSIASPFVGEFYEKPTIDPMERPTDSE